MAKQPEVEKFIFKKIDQST